MKKRTTALILTMLLISSTALSCGNSGKNDTIGDGAGQITETDSETESQTVETEPEWRMFDNLPEEKFGGQSYTILARIENESQFYSNEYTGDSVNDAVYDRNLAVSERYDIVIDILTIDGSWGNNVAYTNTIRASVQAADGAYDLIDGYSAVVGSLVMDGCYLNLNDVDYIEPSERWWSISAVNDLSIDNMVYLTPGDISMSLYDNIFAMFFNQSIFEQLHLGDPYTLVNEGKWTYDEFLKTAEKCQSDVDGNGVFDENDSYGVVFSDDLEFNNFHYAFNIPITLKGGDGYPVFNLGSEQTADLVDTMQTLAYNTSGVYYYKGNDSGKLKMFMEGRVAIMPNLLKTTVSLRDMEDDFGILPYPKYDEAQEGYYTTARDNSVMFGIPIDVKDSSFAGLISEALCQAGYQIVKPIYYETVLKTKLARDDESPKMIDILRDGLIFDMGAVYSLQLGRAGFLTRDCVYYEYEYASYYKSHQKIFEKSLEQFIANFRGEE